MTGVPSNILIPFVGVTFDSSRAVSANATLPVGMAYIGQKTSAGTGAVETLIPFTDPDEAGVIAGVGSMAHRQAIAGLKINKTTKQYLILLADDGTGVEATQTITISGTASETKELVYYIQGERIAVSVVNLDAADDVGAASVTAINAVTSLSWIASYAAGVLTLTCKHKGIAAGDLDARFNYNEGEAFPAGLSVAVGTFTAGTVDPDVQDALDAIGDTWINVGTQPYVDNTSMAAVQDHATAEADVMVQHDGLWYQSKRATRSEMITFGEDTANHNSQFMVTLPSYKRMESTYETAAAAAAACALSVEEDQAVPLHRIPLTGQKPLAASDRWTSTERNQLALAGISTVKDELGVQTEACVTMYLKNSAGANDVAYQQQNTVYQLMGLRYRFVNRILSKYPRAKLGRNAERITKAGDQIMTPEVGKTEAIGWFIQEEKDGQVEGLEDFKAALVVQKDASNANRLNWLLPPDLMNQFIVGSGNMQFRLEEG